MSDVFTDLDGQIWKRVPGLSLVCLCDGKGEPSSLVIELEDATRLFRLEPVPDLCTFRGEFSKAKCQLAAGHRSHHLCRYPSGMVLEVANVEWLTEDAPVATGMTDEEVDAIVERWTHPDSLVREGRRIQIERGAFQARKS